MQLSLLEIGQKSPDKTNVGDPSFARNKTKPIHRWVPWIAGFSSDFVRDVLNKHLTEKATVLDPFAGVGTTLVEAALLGHDVIGFEINPYAALACRVKLSAGDLDGDCIKRNVESLKSFSSYALSNGYQVRSSPPEGFRTRTPFYSPQVLRKVLIVQDFIKSIQNRRIADLFQLAFAATMVSYSNYSYEPSLGTRKAAGRSNVDDFPVADVLCNKISEMVDDIRFVQEIAPKSQFRVINASFFKCHEYLLPKSIDLCITSPPYLNNYHYIRNTRPQLYWLGFITQPNETEHLERENFGKYWQTVRELDELNLDFPNPPRKLVEKITILRSLNSNRGIYGGNGWANYVITYFNDCWRFINNLKYVLKKGGRAFVVLGNSILQGVMIPTDEYLSELAENLGLRVIEISTPRSTRIGNSIIQSDVRVEKARDNQRLYESVIHLMKK